MRSILVPISASLLLSCSFPRYSGTSTAITFHPGPDTSIVVCAPPEAPSLQTGTDPVTLSLNACSLHRHAVLVQHWVTCQKMVAETRTLPPPPDLTCPDPSSLFAALDHKHEAESVLAAASRALADARQTRQEAVDIMLAQAQHPPTATARAESRSTNDVNAHVRSGSSSPAIGGVRRVDVAATPRSAWSACSGPSLLVDAGVGD